MGRDGGEGDESDATRAAGIERGDADARDERASSIRRRRRRSVASISRFRGGRGDDDGAFRARVEAYKTEMTATLARVRLGLASDPRGRRESSTRRTVRFARCRAPSRRRAAPPNPRWRRSHRARGWTVTNRRCEPRRKPRDEPGTETRSRGQRFRGWKTGTTIRARGRRRSSRRRARGRAPRSISSRARSPGRTGRRPRRGPRRRRGGRAPPPRASPLAMAAAEAAAADSDEDRVAATTETKPASSDPDAVPSIARTSTSARRSTPSTRRGRRETRERAENIARASRHSEVPQRPAPTKTSKTASSSAARPTMRRRARWVHVRGARGGASRAGRGCVGSRCSARGGCAAIDVALDRIFLTRKLCVDYEPPPRRGRA